MYRILSTFIFFGLLLFSNATLGQNDLNSKIPEDQREDVDRIKELIRNMYLWQDAHLAMDLDMISDENDSLYLGFDVDQLEFRLQELKSSGFFSEGFVANYARIFRTIDQRLKDREIDYFVGDLPPFGNGANPWCNCQDVPYDAPNPWAMIEIETLDFDDDHGSFLWKWGGLDFEEVADWQVFLYNFQVVKENGVWKIDALEGFDFESYTKTK